VLLQSVCVSLQSPLYNNTRQEAIRTSGTTPACSHAHTMQKLHTLTMILPSSPCSKSSSSSAGAAAAPRAAACFTIFRLVPASSRSRGFPSISLGSPLPPLAMLLTDLPAVQLQQTVTADSYSRQLQQAVTADSYSTQLQQTVTADMLLYDVTRQEAKELSCKCRGMHLLIRCSTGWLLLHCGKGLLLHSTQKLLQA